ncbi:MAG: hypothetical protein GKC09_09330 [Methanosarcinales archaeon]|nr:hypothetical protein [bacterium]NYT10118.1 hypothetical protein [Methanosarcinales archaeon]
MRLLYTPSSSEAKSRTDAPEPASQMMPAFHESKIQAVAVEEAESEIIMIKDMIGWAAALKEVRDLGLCGLDLETTGLDPLVDRVRLIQLAIKGKVFVADILSLGPSIMNDLADLMEDGQVKKVIHNAKFELSMIQASQARRLRPKSIFCTMLASQVCWSGYYVLIPAPKAVKFPWKRSRTDHSLKALSKRHLGLELDKSCQTSDWGSKHLSREQVEYAAKDAEVLLPLYEILSELLRMNRLEEVAELEFKTLAPVVEIELSGLPIEGKATLALLDSKTAQSKEVLHELQDEAMRNGFKPRPKKGKKHSDLINPGSRMDVLGYLNFLGYKAVSTREEDLKALGCPWANKLLRYRRVSRQKKFLEDWLIRTSPVDGRLHAQYFQMATVSGRFSSRKPNAQQIPKRGEDGLAMRRLFKATPGRMIVKADFSGIELRIMAKLSGDKTMIEAFKAGQDLHKLTASKLAGVPLEQVTKEQRQAAKSANFGLIYGASASRFQAAAKEEYGVNMTLEDAERIRQTFFSTYRGVKIWHDGQKISKYRPKKHYFHDVEHGYFSRPLICSTTILGRKRVWGWFKQNTLAKETELFNSPSQGTGADLIKSVMVELYEILSSGGHEEIRMIGSIHDELLLEGPEIRAQEMAQILKDVMKKVGNKILDPVPVDAEVTISTSWGGD